MNIEGSGILTTPEIEQAVKEWTFLMSVRADMQDLLDAGHDVVLNPREAYTLFQGYEPRNTALPGLLFLHRPSEIFFALSATGKWGPMIFVEVSRA